MFQRYIAAQQARTGVRPNERVLVGLVKRPTLVRIVAPRKKTGAIAVFLAIMISTVGAAFVLENLRPRPKRSTGEETANEASAAARRVA